MINCIFNSFNESFTFFCVFPGMLILGLYLTFRLRFVQISQFHLSFSNLINKKESSQGNMSHFEAVSTVLAGNFGTGNISGMAIAIATGGPGALVWMWVMAFLGSAIQYASCFLGVKYRMKNSHGEYVGGPMYYLSHALGWKSLAAVFAILTLFAAISVGGFAQVNSMMLPLKTLGLHPLFCSLLLTFFVAIVLIGGVARLAKFASMIVPLMAFLYLSGALIVLFLHWDLIPQALILMLSSAINPEAAFGGFLGAGLLKTITTGLDRGLFATDAGTGIVPILQAGARSDNPVTDGLVTLVAPFCVMLVCTMTGLVLLVTGAWQQTGLQSTNMVTFAFQEGLGSFGGAAIVIISLLLFGYTTILAWACCAEKAAEYLFGSHKGAWFKYIFITFIPVGAFLQVDLVWALADLCITGMLATNMVGIAALAHEVIDESRRYFSSSSQPQAV